MSTTRVTIHSRGAQGAAHPGARSAFLPAAAARARWNPAFAAFVSIASAACAAAPKAASTPARVDGAEVHAPPTTSVVAAFDPAAGELPEGVATKDGSAYVGFAPLGEIVAVDLHTGKSARFAELPKPVPGKGFMTGLSFGGDGSLYAALVSFDPSVQPGIYRIPAAGGKGALFAKDAKMIFPNGLVFDPKGVLFVTDSAAGAIYRIAPAGGVTAWVTGALLAGDQAACGGSGNPFPIGANGIVLRDGAFFVTNTDKGSIVRVAIEPDGTAGAPEIAAGPDCGSLAGADGLTVDASGGLVVAVNRQNKVVRLSRTGAVDVIVAGGAIDFPATVTWDRSAMIATSFALANASSGKPARPGLLRITERR